MASNRRPLDLYPTDELLTKALLSRVAIAGSVIEPCSGDGAITRVLEARRKVGIVWTNDIDPGHPADFHEDARCPEAAVWQFGADWVVTNPPFSASAELLPLAYEKARVGVAFLLRLTFLEPAGNRAEWLKAHEANLAHLIIFGQPRPSYTGNGNTDSVTTAWMVWTKAKAETKVHFVYRWQNGT